MKYDPTVAGKRKPVNLSLDTGIVAAARSYGLNLSQISEDAIRAATRRANEIQWQEENHNAIEGWNRWYERNGNPLDQFRSW